MPTINISIAVARHLGLLNVLATGLGTFFANLRLRLRRERRLCRRFFGFGTFSALLYGLLFMYASEILALSTRPGTLSALLSIGIAFVFSFVHGAFTGYFWEAMGIQAKGMGGAR